MIYSDDVLSAFLDGEADPALAGEIEMAMQSDPALVARMERLGSNDRLLREAFDEALGAPPARLHGALQAGAADPARSADILAFKPRPKPSARRPFDWTRMAAAAAVVAVLGAGVLVFAPPRLPATQPPATPADGLAPGAALAAALSKAPSGVQARVDGEVLQVALSFKARDGRLCRQFHLGSEASAADGVACHTGRGWRIEGWMAAQPGAGSGYQTAGGADSIAAAMVDRLGLAETLDGPGESSAIRSGWR